MRISLCGRNKVCFVSAYDQTAFFRFLSLELECLRYKFCEMYGAGLTPTWNLDIELKSGLTSNKIIKPFPVILHFDILM